MKKEVLMFSFLKIKKSNKKLVGESLKSQSLLPSMIHLKCMKRNHCCCFCRTRIKNKICKLFTKLTIHLFYTKGGNIVFLSIMD